MFDVIEWAKIFMENQIFKLHYVDLFYIYVFLDGQHKVRWDPDSWHIDLCRHKYTSNWNILWAKTTNKPINQPSYISSVLSIEVSCFMPNYNMYTI